MIKAAAVAEEDYISRREVFPLHNYAARRMVGIKKKVAEELHSRPTWRARGRTGIKPASFFIDHIKAARMQALADKVGAIAAYAAEKVILRIF